jgi:uncharacterized UBP type Zn finger protein
LTNLGNTCYLASVLQCLAQTESFATELQELKISQLGGIGQALQRLLGNLRQEAWSWMGWKMKGFCISKKLKFSSQ